MNNGPDAQGFVFDDDGNVEGRIMTHEIAAPFRTDCLMMRCHQTGRCMRRPGDDCATFPDETKRYMLAHGDATLHREAGVEVDRAPEWVYQHDIEPGLYKHYRGGFYDVLHVGTCSESGTPLVVYQAASNLRVWVRAAQMFEEVLECGRRRFERVVR